MAAGVHVATGLLLLLCLIPQGVCDLAFARKGYVGYSCVDKACVHIWGVSSRPADYIAVISNGTTQTHKPASECPLTIRGLTAEDVGRHWSCFQVPTHSTSSVTPTLMVIPGKAASLRCSFLSSGHRRCSTRRPELVHLSWVDGAGAELQGSQYLIKERSHCDITLTVTFQSPETKRFRCQMSVAGGDVLTSAELLVKAPALKGRGRGFTKDVDTKPKGSSRVVGAAVGVVGCAALTAMVALFVVNRKRTNQQLPSESTSSTDDDVNSGDVIYADITFPAASGGACVQERAALDTEYACIRYK